MTKSRLAQFAVCGLLCISAATNFLLLRRVNALRRSLERALAPSTLTRGAEVPPLIARNARGEMVSLDPRGPAPTLLYVLSPTCGWCKLNRDSVNLLASSIQGNYRVIGVSLSKLGDQRVGTEDYGFPVLMDPSEASISAYRLRGTPQTLVISQTGKIAVAWSGAYTGSVKAEIEAFFRVKLPDLKPSVAEQQSTRTPAKKGL